MLLTRLEDKSNWFSVSENAVDQWIDLRYAEKGGNEET